MDPLQVPTPRVSDLVDLGFGSRVCISNKSPDDADAASAGAIL